MYEEERIHGLKSKLLDVLFSALEPDEFYFKALRTVAEDVGAEAAAILEDQKEGLSSPEDWVPRTCFPSTEALWIHYNRCSQAMSLVLEDSRCLIVETGAEWAAILVPTKPENAEEEKALIFLCIRNSLWTPSLLTILNAVQPLLASCFKCMHLQHENTMLIREARKLLEQNRLLKNRQGKQTYLMHTTMEGVVTNMSSTFQKMLGMSSLEWIGCRSPVSFFTPEEVDQRMKNLEHRLGRRVSDFEVLVTPMIDSTCVDCNQWTLLRKDGKRTKVVIGVEPLFDERLVQIGFVFSGKQI